MQHLMANLDLFFMASRRKISIAKSIILGLEPNPPQWCTKFGMNQGGPNHIVKYLNRSIPTLTICVARLKRKLVTRLENGICCIFPWFVGFRSVRRFFPLILFISLWPGYLILISFNSCKKLLEVFCGQMVKELIKLMLLNGNSALREKFWGDYS